MRSSDKEDGSTDVGLTYTQKWDGGNKQSGLTASEKVESRGMKTWKTKKKRHEECALGGLSTEKIPKIQQREKRLYEDGKAVAYG